MADLVDLVDLVARSRRSFAALAVLAAAGGGIACSSSDSSGTADASARTDASTIRDAASGADAAPNTSDAGTVTATLACDVAIVGGGPGGLHTAFRLTNPRAAAPTGVSSADKVCLFEKNAYLGGRILDVQFGATATDVTGTGAYRLYDNQYTYALAMELGMETVTSTTFSNLRAVQNPGGRAGQFFGYSGDAFKSLYSQTTNDDDMWAQLICGNQVSKDAQRHPNYQSIANIGMKSSREYVTDVLGAQGAQYFFDMNRFRADFTEPVDAAGYMEFGAIDYFGAGTVRYAVPGFSFLINKMRDAIRTKGGRIFLSERVNTITKGTDGTYTVSTPNRQAKAKQVIIATEHGALTRIGGDVLGGITSQKEYQNVQSARSLTVTHKWDRKWWRSNLRYPDASKVVGDALASDAPGIRRADTTIMVDGYCLNSIEMPYTTHHDALQVTRTVYSDDRACLEKYVTLYGTGGQAGEARLNEQILKSLRILFPAMFNGTASEPKITQTHVTEHGEAWYYLKKGALAAGVTNKSLFDWSIRPLPAEKVYLVGDAWYPLGSGWQNAAYVSSIRVLNQHFGMGLESRELEPITCR